MVTGTFNKTAFVGPLAGESFSTLIDALETGNIYANLHNEVLTLSSMKQWWPALTEAWCRLQIPNTHIIASLYFPCRHTPTGC